MKFTKSKYLIKSGGREISNEKLKQFAQNYSYKDQEDIVTIVKNTKYITFAQSIQAMTLSLRKFHQDIGNEPVHFYIMDKPGSEYWLHNILEDEITKLNFQGFVTKNSSLKHVKNLVFFDDHISSGQQIFSRIDELMYDHKYQGAIYIVVGFATKGGLDFLIQNMNHVKVKEYAIYYINLIPQMSEVFGEDHSEDPNFVFKNIEGDVGLYYFDYSMGGIQSTLPQLYTHIIKQPIDRSGVNAFRQELSI